MTRTSYPFTDREVNMPLLRQQVAALGLPDLEDIYRFINPPGPRLVVRCGNLDGAQAAALAAVIAGHDETQRTAEQQSAADALAADLAERAGLAAILVKADGAVTAADVKTLVLGIARRMHRRGVI